MRKLTPFLLAALLCSGLHAEQISEKQAMAIAAKYMEIPADAGKKLVGARTAAEPAEAEYYVFNAGENEGFVIVSGDDELTELVGYSDKGRFDEDQVPENMKGWLEAYAAYVRSVREADASAFKRTLEPGEPVVEPLLASRWNQMEPYNRMCPNAYPTGCVATAMAQVLYAHKWPEQGRGSYEYVTSTSRLSVSADFSQSVYAWDKMKDAYTQYYDPSGGIHNEYTEEEGDAVALLMRDCGVSIAMDYNKDASGAMDADIPFAAEAYFGYHASFYPREAFSTAEFFDLIKTELDAGRPVLHGGSSSYGGHQYVVDGYTTTGMVHVNWGWGGLSDGYFNMDYMNPDEQGVGGSIGGFSYMQSIVTMNPDREEGKGSRGQQYLFLQGYYGEGELSTTVKSLKKGNTMTVKVEGLLCMSQIHGYAGELGIGIFGEDRTLVDEPAAPVGISVSEMSYDLKPKSLNLKDELAALSDGVYYLYAMTREDGYGKWVRLASQKRIQIEVNGEEISVVDPELNLTLAAPIEASEEEISQNDRVTFTFTVHNPTHLDTEGKLYWEIRDAETKRVRRSGNINLLLYNDAKEECVVKNVLIGSSYEVGKTYEFALSSFSTSGWNIPQFGISSDVEPYRFTVVDNATVSEIDGEEVSIYASEGWIVVEGTDEAVAVYDATGRLLVSSEERRIPVKNPGIYFVRVGEKTQTVILR